MLSMKKPKRKHSHVLMDWIFSPKDFGSHVSVGITSMTLIQILCPSHIRAVSVH